MPLTLLRALALALLAASAARAQDLPRTGWTATASSFQPGDEAANTLDGTDATWWHSAWDPNTPNYPHQITISFNGQTNSITGLKYQVRGDGSDHGRIGDFEIYLSTDGTTFPATPKAKGTWANSVAVKTVTFAPQNAKALRLVALSPAVAGQPWASAGEITVQGTAATTPPPPPDSLDPPLSRTGWTITADSDETDSKVGAFIDGNDDTMWHTAWRNGNAPLPHTVSVVFPATATVSGFTYLPRQDTSPNGRWGQFDVRSGSIGLFCQVRFRTCRVLACTFVTKSNTCRSRRQAQES